MTALRVFLVIILLAIASYTAVVIVNHGMNLLPIFFGDMATLTWPGQFNLDFMCMLLLSGLWVSWRQQFSAPGLALGLLAVFGGAFFLSIYLIIVSFQVRGDSKALLLGKSRSTQNNS